MFAVSIMDLSQHMYGPGRVSRSFRQRRVVMHQLWLQTGTVKSSFIHSFAVPRFSMSEASSVTISCVGGFSGSVQLAGTACTVGELRKAIAERLGTQPAGCAAPKLILAGKALQDDCKLLAACGVTSSSRVLVLAGKSAPQATALQAQEDRAANLDCLKAAVEAMATRSSNGSADKFAFEIENQSGMGLHLTDEDKKALGIGLAMHSRGKESLSKGCIKDGLQELLLAEVAFELASPAMTEQADNVPLLLLDIAWSYFLLQDSSKLVAASSRLRKAREGLSRSHGEDLSRLRMHCNFAPELAVYVRLELLEGVAAFYRGENSGARERLLSAQAKWQQLQISDTALAALLDMGFSTKEASRALRFCGDDLNQAAEHAFEQQRLAQDRKQKDKEVKETRKEQQMYGKTSSGKPVNMEVLRQLDGLLGFDRALIAQALIRADNSGDAALDLLTNSDSREQLQSEMSRNAEHKGEKRRRESSREQLLQLGFACSAVDTALERLGSSCHTQAALDMLLSGNLAVHENQGPLAGTSNKLNDAEQQSMPTDHELENSVARAIDKDPLSAYDVDVTIEGQAIQEYLDRVSSTPQEEVE